MKTKFFTLCAIVATSIFSCKDDAETPSYSFKNQDASGKIGNVAWTYADGYADIFEGEIDVDLFLTQDGAEGCDVSSVDGDRVFFYIPNEVGVHRLNLSLEDGLTVTLFDDEEFMNYVAAEGAIEIVSVSDTEVTGKIDARVDGETFINGNFTVSLCH